jgi:nitrilase
MDISTIAVVQQPPVLLDRTATIERAVDYVEQAAKQGARMVVFTEAFIPGYPAWLWRLRPGSDWGLTEELHAQLLNNAVDLKAGHLQPLCAAAKKHNVTVVCGMDERDYELSQATLYNTVVVISHDGDIINHHRKLMPTNPERMAWGFGDATGLNVVDTPIGRIGTLLCWENYMPLARYALYAQGIDIYIAPTYDSGDGWIGTLQHIAREAQCWVVGSGNILHATDLPPDLPGREQLYPDADEWINGGDSVVIEPGGNILAGPMRQEKGILYAAIDTQRVSLARRTLDIVGHYARPDIFTLHVNRQPQKPVVFD